MGECEDQVCAIKGSIHVTRACICLCRPFCTRSQHVTCCVFWELSHLKRLIANPNHDINAEPTSLSAMANNTARVSVLFVEPQRLREHRFWPCQGLATEQTSRTTLETGRERY